MATLNKEKASITVTMTVPCVRGSPPEEIVMEGRKEHADGQAQLALPLGGKEATVTSANVS